MRYLKSIWVVIGLCMLLAACKKECLHEYQSEITLAVSCTQAGEETFTCVHCEDSYKQTIPALDHTYAPSDIEKEATCSEVGSQKYVCTDCGSVKTQTIEKLAHTLGEAYISKEPNCTDEGEYSATCTVCGESEIVEAIPTNNNHVFINTVIREATCIDPGEGVNTCSLCQYSEPCEYALTSHSYGAAKVTKEASCTEKGQKTYTCTVCQGVRTESTPMKDHTWNDGACNSPNICTICGHADTKNSGHNFALESEQEARQNFAGEKLYRCSRCNITKTSYFGQNGKYDFEAVKAVGRKHARKLGFGTAPADYDIHTGKKKVYQQPYALIEMMGGQKALEQGAVEIVNSLYDYFLSNGIDPADGHLVITVSYKTSGALGTGIFYITVTA